MESAVISCSVSEVQTTKPWILSASVALLKHRQCIPSDASFDTQRKSVKRQLTKSLKKDHEQWWIEKAKEIEQANAAGNSRKLFQLIRNTGPRKPNVSETIRSSDGTIVHSVEQRLNRWANHFKNQFSWPKALSEFAPITAESEWSVNLDPPTSSEIETELHYLKRNKAAGPDGLTPALFKEGGQIPVQEFTVLLQCI